MKRSITILCTAVLLTALTGCSPKVNTSPETTYDPNQSPPVYETLTLYFPSADGTQLVKETQVIEITNDEAPEEWILQQLLKGPKGQELSTPIASGTTVLSVSTEDGLCTIDFSEEFLNSHPLAVQAILHSLCQLDTIDAVKINVAGNTEAIFDDNLVLASPLLPTENANMKKKPPA